MSTIWAIIAAVSAMIGVIATVLGSVYNSGQVRQQIKDHSTKLTDHGIILMDHSAHLVRHDIAIASAEGFKQGLQLNFRRHESQNEGEL